MAEYLLDTDVLVDHLRAGVAVPVPHERAAFSSLTRAELYSGRHVDENVVDDLLSAFGEIALDRSIAEEAGRLRREGNVPLADAVIAATALVTGRVLVTRNLKHFAKIRELKVHRRAP